MIRMLRGALVAVLLLAPAMASGQTAQVGQVRGALTDETGGVLPGGVVVLVSEERGFSRTAVTDGEGRYLFAAVPPGRYTVRVSMPGFEATEIPDNLVEAEKTTTVPVSPRVASVEVTATVIGEVPVVDRTNQTRETRLRADEFQKMPFTRQYQTLIGQAPGVVGVANVNAHGALGSNNVFLFDGVNTTDTATGTTGASLNYEAIEEVLIRTSTLGAEFGRGTGAVVDVITKSGTNRFGGSFKYLAANDAWDAQNGTRSELDGSPLARTRFDRVQPTLAATGGGPIRRDRLWVFGAWERAEVAAPAQQTNAKPGAANENYQQETVSPYWTVRADSQLALGHTAWIKYSTSPTNGFVRDYWGRAAERSALTLQDQTADQLAAQYTGVFGSNWTASLTMATADEIIEVVPFEAGSLDQGAPYVDVADGRFYNGSTFDGRVSRPRTQATGAVEFFGAVGRSSHAIKAGVDWQRLESESHFRFPTSRLFYVSDFDPAARTFTPLFYERYDDDPSTSEGHQLAVYARDRLQLGRVSVEAGLRVEKQTGTSDIGRTTVDAVTIAPRLSGSYALRNDGKTVLVGSYGRFHDAILQEFSDQFASVPQQGSYELYVWNGSAYELDGYFPAGANTFMPNRDVSPRRMDETTVGVEHQLSRVLGVAVRFISRDWSNFIDDVYAFAPDGSIGRVVENLDEAERSYRGLEIAVQKRLANGWAGAGSYTWSRTRGNHFADVFTTLGDFAGASCHQTADTGLGDVDGVFPCGDLAANQSGRPAWDRPHAIKFNGAYTREVAGIALTGGVVGAATSKATHSRTRTVSVLQPGTLTPSGQTRTYFYEPRGSERIDGMQLALDLALEAAYRTTRRAEVGVKLDVFNLFNTQSKIGVNNESWCAATTSAACQTAVASYGTATARGAFQPPRAFRLTLLVRY